MLLIMVKTGRLESEDYEFKTEFQGTSREWVEIVKDMVAMANSGGGLILLGVDDDGEPSLRPVIKMDPASVTDKIFRYCGDQFSNFTISIQSQNGKALTEIRIRATTDLLVFTSPGTYEICTTTHKQHTAFSKGTIYFRHGAKSEPANGADLRRWAEQIANKAVFALKENLRQVVELPAGQRANVQPIMASLEDGGEKICLTNDPNATAARMVDPYTTHPYRQKDLLTQFNTRMKDKIKISSHDVLCIRKAFNLEKRPDFYYKPPIKNYSGVYSDLFLHWLIEQYNLDAKFFENTRKSIAPSKSEPIESGPEVLKELERLENVVASEIQLPAVAFSAEI